MLLSQKAVRMSIDMQKRLAKSNGDPLQTGAVILRNKKVQIIFLESDGISPFCNSENPKNERGPERNEH